MSEQEISPRRRTLRRAAFIGAPVLAAVLGGAALLFGGRYVGTDDAYVKASKVNVGSEIAGTVLAVAVHENQPVAVGDVLLRLDPAPFEVAVHQAEARLAQARLQVESYRAAYSQKVSAQASAAADVAYQRQRHQRVRELRAQGVIAGQQFDDVRHALDVSENRLSELEHDRSEALSRLGGKLDLPAEQHPEYLAALAALAKARLDLEHTTLRAPIAGVASKVPEPGTYAMPGLPLISVVAEAESWVEANFKESELEHLRPGQAVKVEIDSYPGTHWRATVDSIGQATGSEFSLLPAQNATGNWVKVVQRVPVRIRLEHQPDEPPLRSGMSADVSVDTGVPHNRKTFLASLGIGEAHAAP